MCHFAANVKQNLNQTAEIKDATPNLIVLLLADCSDEDCLDAKLVLNSSLFFLLCLKLLANPCLVPLDNQFVF